MRDPKGLNFRLALFALASMPTSNACMSDGNILLLLQSCIISPALPQQATSSDAL